MAEFLIAKKTFDIFIKIDLIGFKKDLSKAYFNFEVNNFDVKENANIFKKGLEFSFGNRALNWVALNKRTLLTKIFNSCNISILIDILIYDF